MRQPKPRAARAEPAKLPGTRRAETRDLTAGDPEQEQSSREPEQDAAGQVEASRVLSAVARENVERGRDQGGRQNEGPDEQIVPARQRTNSAAENGANSSPDANTGDDKTQRRPPLAGREYPCDGDASERRYGGPASTLHDSPKTSAPRLGAHAQMRLPAANAMRPTMKRGGC